MKHVIAVVLCLVTALVLLASVAGQPAYATTCAEYSNQAAAQQAANTRDGDGDGVYCESLPCPCANPAGDSGGGPKTVPPAGTNPTGCVRPSAVQNISFSKTKHPNIRRHLLGALRKGWPRTLVVNRPGADARRDRLLAPYPTRPGQDRDEYPPAVGRGKGAKLERGVSPTGWRADVRYVASSENRSHGSTLGAKLRRLCNGTRFRYVFF
jgi:Deoxyribonuclease NucA/NucB